MQDIVKKLFRHRHLSKKTDSRANFIFSRNLVFGILFAFCFEISLSAPMPQVGPYTIKGTIQEISWTPEKFLKKIPGASGTLGKDRVIPAHYNITLAHTEVLGQNSRNSHPSYQSGKIIRVTINHPKNDGYLRNGMVIQIFGYRVRGDEGGTWYSSRRVVVVRK